MLKANHYLSVKLIIPKKKERICEVNSVYKCVLAEESEEFNQMSVRGALAWDKCAPVPVSRHLRACTIFSRSHWKEEEA